MAGTSSCMNVKYLRSNFVSYQNVIIKGQQTQVMDVFDPNYTKVCKGLSAVNALVYDGSTHITTLTYKYYQQTSCFWLLLLMNAVIHPLNIPGGQVFLLPSLNSVTTNNIPSTVAGVKTTRI